MLYTIIKIVFYCFYVIFYFYDDKLYVVHNSAYEEMYIDLYNTINIYMINYNIIFFVVRIGSRGYSYNIFNLQVIIIRFSLSNP